MVNPAKGWCFARPSAALGRAKAPLYSALAGTKVDVGITCHTMVGCVMGREGSTPLRG